MRDWLGKRHPIYTARQVEWLTNERRYRGGTHVLCELRRFDWETALSDLLTGAALLERETQAMAEQKHAINKFAGTPGEHYRQRQGQAIYLNFPEAFLTMLRGHLFKKRPTPDGSLKFGTLGDVRKDREGADPTNAELVFFNVDGVGNDGSQWDSWWSDVTAWAGVTGHRWVFVEATTTPGVTAADVQAGKRPYLVHHSPLDVLNWDYVEGRLAWALVQMPPRPARMEKSELVRDSVGPTRLYVRTGHKELVDDGGLDFSGGGWWTFDEKGNQLLNPGDMGLWKGTKGEIPLWPHFYQRDKENMSRPAITELGNAAVAHMNLGSAADYDAWDAASSLQFLLGVDPDSFQVAMDKVQEGAKFIPVPVVRADPGNPNSGSVTPSVQDSAAGAVTADVFLKRTDSIRASVREITGMEVSGIPSSSGLSKQAGFGETKSPRLGLLASEVETSQNIALFFLEQRFGSARPKGSVTWTRDFELAPLLDSIERFFTIEKTSGITSPTLGAKAMMQVAQETGLITDDLEAATIESEYEDSAGVAAASRAQDAGLSAEFGRGGTNASTAPKIDPVTGQPIVPAVDPNATVPPIVPPSGQQVTTQDTVLNGAQVTAAVDIVTLVASGEIPRDSGVNMLIAFFNIDATQAEKIMGKAGTAEFTPTAKPTAPVPPGPPSFQIQRGKDGKATGINPAPAPVAGTP